MVESVHRPTKIKINCDHLGHNVRQVSQQLPASAQLMAVVKADAYGHGAVQVAQVALAAGAQSLGVSNVDEALELRRAGIEEAMVLILGPCPLESLALLVRHRISVTVTNQAWLEAALAQWPADLAGQLAVHLAVDTGMNRIGVKRMADLDELVAIVTRDERLVFEGVFTHFATADQEDKSYFNQQAQHFQTVIAQLKAQPRYIHSANSATLLFQSPPTCQIYRVGVALYGINPSGGDLAWPPDLNLRPVLSLTTEISHVKQVEAGESISYGAVYTAQQDEWIATLPIGYADGWHRRLQGFSVLVDGHYCPIVGRICMDQCMIRLPKAYPVGTQVVLIGRSGPRQISAEDVASYAQTIPYEIVCSFSQRVPRFYTGISHG